MAQRLRLLTSPLWIVLAAGLLFGPVAHVAECSAPRVVVVTATAMKYCIDPAFNSLIQDQVRTIRQDIKAQQSAGKLIVYASTPISPRGGGHTGTISRSRRRSRPRSRRNTVEASGSSIRADTRCPLSRESRRGAASTWPCGPRSSRATTGAVRTSRWCTSPARATCAPSSGAARPPSSSASSATSRSGPPPMTRSVRTWPTGRRGAARRVPPLLCPARIQRVLTRRP